MNRSRGLTLVEVLVAASLALVVLTVAWDCLRAGLDLWRDDLALGSAQSQCLALESRLTSELLHTTAESVTAGPGYLACLLPAATFQPDNGLPLWSRFVVYWLAQGCVTRSECGHTSLPGPRAQALAISELQCLPPGTIVARDVERFQCQLTGSLVEVQIYPRGQSARVLTLRLQKVRP